jgi:hypothetical protein
MKSMRLQITVNLPDGEIDSFCAECKDLNAAYAMAIAVNPSATSVTIIHVIGA